MEQMSLSLNIPKEQLFFDDDCLMGAKQQANGSILIRPLNYF